VEDAPFGVKAVLVGRENVFLSNPGCKVRKDKGFEYLKRVGRSEMGLNLEGSVEGDLVFGIGVSMAVDRIAGI